MYFASFRLVTYELNKTYPVESASRQKTYFPCLVVNDAEIQKAIIIDTVHEHECLILVFGINVQFVSNRTNLYIYILTVQW